MKTKPNKLNVRLLRRVQKAIVQHANQFQMEAWADHLDSKGNAAGGCGTSACIAGWTLAFTERLKKLTPLREQWDIGSRAAKALNLDEREADRLFHTEDWPLGFVDGYDDAKTSKQAARIAAKRIDHFINTGQ